MGTDKSMEMVMKLPNDAAGIWKLFPIVRSRVVPCLTKRVLTCAKIVVGTRVVSQTRNIPKNNFVVSTSVTVQGLVLSFSAALSRNLQLQIDIC